jgi:RNA polymerase sigma-70 factor (ECF subfamily)
MDERMVARAQAGDARALETLVRQYDRPMVRYFYRLSRDAELAKDLRQELFCKLLSVLPRYDARRAKFKTWFYRLARNLAIDRIYRRRKPDTESLPENVSVSDSSEAPRQAAEIGEVRSALLEALAGLPEVDRTIIALKHETDLTFEEIGKTLGMPASTVKSRLYRSFETVRGDLVARGHNM